MIDRDDYLYLDDSGGRTMASIHDMGLENDVCVNPDYEYAGDLLLAIGTRLFGATAEAANEQE